MKQASTQEQTEKYFNILRGGVTHPIGRMKYIDDNGAIQTISQDVISIDIKIDRDDERETNALLIPPASTMTVQFSNVNKQFVTGFGGTFDGVIQRGRRFLPELGHKIEGTDEYFEQGLFISDDPSFNVDPEATVSVSARDFFGVLVDSDISLPTYASIKAEDYIIEILKRIGLKATEYNIPLTATTLTTTPVIENENAAELVSEVMEYLQLEDDYRLIMKNQKINLEVPSTDVLAADYVFHWVLHVTPPYTRRDDTLKLLKRLTVYPSKPTVNAGYMQGSQSGKTEADLPFVHAFTNGPAIRVFWQQGAADTLEIVETARTVNSITLDRRFPAATGSWSLAVWGDQVTSGNAGEAASGENIRLNRGKTLDLENRFVQNSTEAKNLADALGVRRFSEKVTAEFSAAHGWLLGEINDLIRIVEKYSDDKRLYHQIQLTHHYTSNPARLDTRIIAEFAGLTEVAQKYDLGFLFDAGRIYDEQYPVGNQEQEDTSFRGAIRTVP